MITLEERDTKKIPGITSFFIKFNYNPNIVNELKTLYCKIYNEKTCEWEIPINLLSEVIDRLSKYDDLSISFKKENIERSLDTIELPKLKEKPFPHQIEGIKYGLCHNNWLLLDAMGLGKSYQAIEIADAIKAKHKIKHCLIICGVNSLKGNWKNEVKKFSNYDALILGERLNKKGRLVIGSIKDRVAQLKAGIDQYYIITNIETIRDNDVLKYIKKLNPEMIIFDEMHKCKDSQSQQGSHLLRMNKAKYKLGMSGTLLLNDPLDLYVPLKWIGAEKSNLTTFKSNYCICNNDFHNIIIGYRNLNMLKYQLSKYSLRRTKDILGLPPRTIIPEYLDMNNDQNDFYRNIEKGIVDEVDKVKISTTSLLAMVSRLRQATVNPQILTSENISSIKLDRAVELANEIVANGDKVVIFSTFKEPCYELGQRLKEFKPLVSTGDESNDVDEKRELFQNNKDVKILIATWSKWGTGQTLTAARYMIFLDTPWTWAIFDQSCDRIHRIGTQQAVFIYNLIVKDSIDEKVWELVNTKKALGDYLIDDHLSNDQFDQLKKYIEDLKIS